MGIEILGPIVLPDILTGERYVELLRENLPDFRRSTVIGEKQNCFSTRRC